MFEFSCNIILFIKSIAEIISLLCMDCATLEAPAIKSKITGGWVGSEVELFYLDGMKCGQNCPNSRWQPIGYNWR